MEQQHLPKPEALAHIKRVDQERREWTRFLFNVDWEDPSLYDLVLSLGGVALETAIETVIGLAKTPEFECVSLQALQDRALRFRVLTALAMDFRTRGADLHVTAETGIVTVTGTTHWQEMVDAVPAVVREVEGVREVRSEITGVTPLHPLNFF
jgi:osmotically-inducible protein OsmY